MSELKPTPFDLWWNETGQYLPQNPLDATRDAWEAACEHYASDLSQLRDEVERLKSEPVPQYAVELRDAAALVAQLTADLTRLRALLVRCHDAITMEAIATEKFTEPPERCSAWWELRRTIAAELERSK